MPRGKLKKPRRPPSTRPSKFDPMELRAEALGQSLGQYLAERLNEYGGIKQAADKLVPKVSRQALTSKMQAIGVKPVVKFVATGIPYAPKSRKRKQTGE